MFTNDSYKTVTILYFVLLKSNVCMCIHMCACSITMCACSITCVLFFSSTCELLLDLSRGKKMRRMREKMTFFFFLFQQEKKEKHFAKEKKSTLDK